MWKYIFLKFYLIFNKYRRTVYFSQIIAIHTRDTQIKKLKKEIKELKTKINNFLLPEKESLKELSEDFTSWKSQTTERLNAMHISDRNLVRDLEKLLAEVKLKSIDKQKAVNNLTILDNASKEMRKKLIQ